MSEQIKIYVRNSQKYGKILNVSSSISAEQLYRRAAQTQNLNSSEVQLILGGRPVPNDSTQISLKDKAIVHIINRRQVEFDTISINIKSLYGRSGPAKYEIMSSSKVGTFINQNLIGIYGQQSDKLILVHIGRQLDAEKTFQQELIQNNSELICASLEQIRQKNLPKPAQEVINVPIKDLQVPEQPKDIYPTPNFPICVPQQISANNNLDLIFDSKVRHASSLPKCDLQPQEIIPQQELTTKQSQQVKQVEEVRQQQNEEIKQQEEVVIQGESQVVEEQKKYATGLIVQNLQGLEIIPSQLEQPQQQVISTEIVTQTTEKQEQTKQQVQNISQQNNQNNLQNQSQIDPSNTQFNQQSSVF